MATMSEKSTSVCKNMENIPNCIKCQSDWMSVCIFILHIQFFNSIVLAKCYVYT